MIGVEIVGQTVDARLLYGVGGALALFTFLMNWSRKASARNMIGGKRLAEGRVRAFTGLMGGGKSTLLALMVLHPWLKRGRTVVTNFGCDPAEQGLTGNVVLLSSQRFLEELLEIGTDGTFVNTLCTCERRNRCKDHQPEPVPHGCLACRRRLRCSCNGVKVCIDECQVFIPSNNSKSLPIELKSWITLARKNHIELIWLAQSHKDVHAMLRRLTAECWQCTDVATNLVTQKFLMVAGEPDKTPIESMSYRWNYKANGLFNSWEIIIPARDALEMAGKLDSKYIDRLEATGSRRKGESQPGGDDGVGVTGWPAPVAS